MQIDLDTLTLVIIFQCLPPPPRLIFSIAPTCQTESCRQIQWNPRHVLLPVGFYCMFNTFQTQPRTVDKYCVYDIFPLPFFVSNVNLKHNNVCRLNKSLLCILNLLIS